MKPMIVWLAALLGGFAVTGCGPSLVKFCGVEYKPETTTRVECNDKNVTDVSPLRRLTHLEQLDLGGTAVEDLSPLAGLHALKELYLFNTKVRDLSPLEGLKALVKLVLTGTPARRNAKQLAKLKSNLPALRPLMFEGGYLDTRTVQRQIRAQERRFRFCYEKELRQNQNLRGTVVVEFTVSSTGRVSRAKVIESTLQNEKVEACVAERMRWTTFKNPNASTVTVRYQFQFEAR
ncbi:MAG: TonB family protein [Myxococcales bacterium]|nr:TonB family protein [Myxococcales bacterium]